MNFDPNKPIVTLTKTAAGHVRRLMDSADNDVIGIRVGVKTAGCSGMQYDVQFATEQKPFEDKLQIVRDAARREGRHRPPRKLLRDQS